MKVLHILPTCLSLWALLRLLQHAINRLLNPVSTKDVATQALKLRGPVPKNANPTVMAAVVKQHLDAPSMWAIFPLQDLLALSPAFGSRPAAEETINDPTNPRHYWRFRIHVRLEDLLADDKYLGDLQALFLGECTARPRYLSAHGRCGDCLVNKCSAILQTFHKCRFSAAREQC